MTALLGQKVLFTNGDYVGPYDEAFGISCKASDLPNIPTG